MLNPHRRKRAAEKSPPLSPNSHWIPTYSSLSEMSSSAEHAEEGEWYSDLIVQSVNDLVRQGYSALVEKKEKVERKASDGSAEMRYNALVAARVRKEQTLQAARAQLQEMRKEEERLEPTEGGKAIAALQNRLSALHDSISRLESDDEKYLFITQRCEETNSILQLRTSRLKDEVAEITQQIRSADDIILIDENWTQSVRKQREVTESYIRSMREQRIQELTSL